MAYDLWVVGPCHIADDEVAVAIDVVVEVLGAEYEAADRFPGENLLLTIVDDTLLDEGQHAVGDGFGVQAEVLVIA